MEISSGAQGSGEVMQSFEAKSDAGSCVPGNGGATEWQKGGICGREGTAPRLWCREPQIGALAASSKSSPPGGTQTICLSSNCRSVTANEGVCKQLTGPTEHSWWRQPTQRSLHFRIAGVIACHAWQRAPGCAQTTLATACKTAPAVDSERGLGHGTDLVHEEFAGLQARRRTVHGHSSTSQRCAGSEGTGVYAHIAEAYAWA
mmetsp:Transcript_36794/g.84747  ORF Transcript_36794/g.84747 Transcript_36794/m.84747 type:complete len:203 (-) Transcript_36794:167-775(-)